MGGLLPGRPAAYPVARGGAAHATKKPYRARRRGRGRRRLPDRRGLCQRAGGAAVFHCLRAGAGAVRRGAGLRPAGRGRRGNAVGRRAGRRLHPLVRPAAGQAAGLGVAGGAVRCLHRHAGGGRGAAAKRVRPACRGGPRGDVRRRAGHRAGRPGPHDRYPGPRRPADRRLCGGCRRGGAAARPHRAASARPARAAGPQLVGRRAGLRRV